MSDKIKADLDFRTDYFGPASLEKHFGGRVKGELSCQAAMDMASSGEYDDEVMSSTLTDMQRSSAGAVHPHFM